MAALYRLDPDLSCTRLDAGYICTNGSSWSPDGTILYVSDTYAEAIHAYDYDAASGTVSGNRLFAATEGTGQLSRRCDGRR